MGCACRTQMCTCTLSKTHTLVKIKINTHTTVRYCRLSHPAHGGERACECVCLRECHRQDCATSQRGLSLCLSYMSYHLGLSPSFSAPHTHKHHHLHDIRSGRAGVRGPVEDGVPWQAHTPREMRRVRRVILTHSAGVSKVYNNTCPR